MPNMTNGIYGTGKRPPRSWRKARRRAQALANRTGKRQTVRLGNVEERFDPKGIPVRTGPKPLYVSNLAMAKSHNGHCPHCEYYPNKLTTRPTSDKGLYELHKCERCGKFLRKYTPPKPRTSNWGWGRSWL